MALYEDKLSLDLVPSAEDMEALATQKAQELFRVCDKENKGYMTKMDMRRLQSELSLTPDQLDAVFDSLDDNGNGHLTLDEFIEGFGSYLGFKTSSAQLVEDNIYEDEIDGVEDMQFQQMINNIGASTLFEDERTIKSLWSRLRRDDQDMASNFEDFLFKISTEMRRTKGDVDTLENALKVKSSTHDEEVRKLYEEMESQIKEEKRRIMHEEQIKEQQLKEEMEQELQDKERQLQELLQKHQEMEEKMTRLNMAETETKQENEKLMKEKDELEEMLMRSQDGLEESRAYINQLRDQQTDEKKERAKAALKLMEGIAVERESLVKQLHSLRDVNKQLRDDQDIADARRIDLGGTSMSEELSQILEAKTATKEPPRRLGTLSKQGSILGDYFPDARPRNATLGYSISEDDVDDVDDIEVDDDYEDEVYTNNNNQVLNESFDQSLKNQKFKKSYYGQGPLTMDDLDMTSSGNDTDGKENNKQSRLTRNKQRKDGDPSPLTNNQRGSTEEGVLNGPRGQPVGADLDQDIAEVVPLQQRVFKIVFVGDSGVGKSSFIHRFCNDTFNPSFSATIGVDFQVKTLHLPDVLIVLQLWDTAGQERFRSITKQYFRKADGVIVMYDVTSEQSFVNVNNWMSNIKENVDNKTVLVVIGNKTDLADNDDKRVIKKKDGSKLAQDYDCIFYESSAQSGANVKESMEALANRLKDKEDEEMEKILHLQDEDKKSSCCS